MRPSDDGPAGGSGREPGKGWGCEAYGPDLPGELGDLCFYGEIEQCTSHAQCHVRMASERQRVFRRMNELAAAGDPTGEYLAGEFTNPSQILGTDDPDGNETTGGDGKTALPVLYLTQDAVHTWQQHEPGGCRCVCRLYHDDPGVCLEPAEPGHLLRVVAPANPALPADISELLQICAACYAAIAPLTSTPPATN